jgi:hypothetical protein
MRGDGRQRAEQCQRLKPHGHRGALPDLDVVRPERRIAIGVEDEVEQRPFGGLRDVDVVREAAVGVGGHALIAPGRDVMSGAVQEESELHHGRTLAFVRPARQFTPIRGAF